MDTFNAVEVRDRLIEGIRRLAQEQHFTKVVLGISGGKDSTVSAALCARALGKENVLGIMMPDGEQADIADSIQVCEALGIPHDAIEFHKSLYAQDYDFFYGELCAAEGVVVAVGHIPFMEEVASDFAKRMMSFTKGSVACFDVPGSLAKAQLLWFARGPRVG